LQPRSVSSAELSPLYEEYKQKYRERKARAFFDAHKDEAWFKERYHPNYMVKQRKKMEEHIKLEMEKFWEELNNGSLDYDLDSKEERLSPLRVETSPVEEGSPVESKKRPIEETAASEKRARVEIETKEEKEATSATSSSEKSGERAPEESSGAEGVSPKREEDAEDIDKTTLFMSNVPPTMSREELESLAQTEDAPVEELCLSEPKRHKAFSRYAWLRYKLPSHAAAALASIRHKIEKEKKELFVAFNTRRFAARHHMAPPIASLESCLSEHLELAKRLVHNLDHDFSLPANALLDLPEKEVPALKEKLDKLIAYLRRVHLLCFYNGEQFVDKYDLEKKIGLGTKRVASPPDETDVYPRHREWQHNLKNKLVQLAKLGSKPFIFSGEWLIQEKQKTFFENNTLEVQKEQSQVYRCAIPGCGKLFRANQYVVKHLENKHTDRLDGEKGQALEEQYFQNYYTDPRRILPEKGQRRRSDRDRGRDRYRRDSEGRGYVDLDAPSDTTNSIVTNRTVIDYGDLD